MALIYPRIDTIRQMNPRPTEGELHLVNFLINTLNDEYEIFFQPFINGDMPDVVIMRKGGGVYIIEVKDWNLSSYEQYEHKFYVNKNRVNDRQLIKSPIQQVNEYKTNLFNLHIDGLMEKKNEDSRNYGIVNCGVYFHKATQDSVNAFISKRNGKYEDDKYHEAHKSYLRKISFTDLIGNDNLTEQNLATIFEKRWLSKKSYLFTEELYNKFQRAFKPPLHTLEQGIEILYNSKQQTLIKSDAGKSQKARGVAGSGKTMCLARRAVNAHKRTNKNVLILFYNITLRNYIHDKISQIRDSFTWSNFHMMHYHDFFNTQARNHNLLIRSLGSYEDPNFFDLVRDKIVRYDTIIIDEIQDYTDDWVKLIRKYFLADGGEWVVFGDEKQNIYERAYDITEKKPYTGVGGAWTVLNESYRVSTEIALLAERFQTTFFANKYEFDAITSTSTQLGVFSQSEIRYYDIGAFNPVQIWNLIESCSQALNEHDNDICVQSSKIETLRELDHLITSHTALNVKRMFETQDEFNRVLDKYKLTFQQFKHGLHVSRTRIGNWTKEDLDFARKAISANEDIETIRKNRKFHFWNNPGYLKMSTVHSYKGWEISTLFLIIRGEENGENESYMSDEMIYTAITRCRRNLIVINCGNNRYNQFFEQYNIKPNLSE